MNFGTRVSNPRLALLASLREHSLLIGIVLLHLLVGAAMPWLLGRDLHFELSFREVAEAIETIGFWCVLLACVAGFAGAAIRKRHGGPLASAWHWLREDFLRPDRIWGGLIVMALLPIFAWNFAFLQALLPLLHGFNWDPVFAAWDRSLHFGRQPWEWLQPVVGYPLVTSMLSLAYAGWFLALYGVNVWQAFARRDPVTRMQYLLCTMLIWAVLGNLGCTLLASGGPVYYGRLTGLPDPFAPLMNYLNAAAAHWPNLSLKVQEKMWRIYSTNGQGGEINGAIAAMPSLHVATACSFYLVARAALPKLAWAFGAFLTIMLIGSVHLGWHYAIDGYAGILGTLALWHLCGWLLRRPEIRWLLWNAAPGSKAGPGARSNAGSNA